MNNSVSKIGSEVISGIRDSIGDILSKLFSSLNSGIFGWENSS